MPDQSTAKQVRKLADAVAYGTASAEETARLSQLLLDDPQAQDLYLEYVDLHAVLCWEFRGAETKPRPASAPASEPQRMTIPPARRLHFLWGLSLFSIASMVAVAVGAAWFLRHARPADSRQDQFATFCQLTQTVGERWNAASLVQAGDRLGSRRLTLEAGMAELIFDNGVRAVLAGPAELELVDSMKAYLHSGRVVFRVPPPAIGFVCETADANVMDLGTEFGVHAEELVGTELQVFEGEVVANGKSDEAEETPGRRLEAGQAVLFARGDGAHPQEISFWPERFVRYLPDPNDPEFPNDPGRRKVQPYNLADYDAIHIVPATGTVKIDGSLDDWDLSGQFASHCEPPYDAFYHLRGAMMYDQQYLYIGAEVGDPFPMRSVVSPREGRELYGNGGGLAFRISTDRAMGWPVRGEGAGTEYRRDLVAEDYNNKLAFLMLWFYEPEDVACLNIRYGMDRHGTVVNPPGYRGAFRKHPDGWGYTVEYAIPWSLLNAADDPPRADDVLGCTWLVHWAGPEGRNWRGQLIDGVNPLETGWNFQRAATWGKAIYHEQGDLPPGTVVPLAQPVRAKPHELQP
ncbi:MAG: hypothetical protein WD030_07850 [Pirellulales bacterium]